MKKIILVPHTHWDREWYFTDQTSALLLERMKNDIAEQKHNFPFNLDGQASLAEELSGNKNTQEYLTNNNIVAGPLFIQQDTFNVLFGTTINNIEMGKRVLGKNIPKTVYMPDTFGFNEQLPQIFKHFKFDNFIAWRGIKFEDKIKSNFFKWKGIDGTQINSSYMAEGYYCLGQHFPYNQEKNYDNFISELYKYIKYMERKDNRNIYWAPLGGDQAPYEKDVLKAVQEFNKKYKEYNLVIGTHDDYFNEIKKDNKNIIDTRLDYSGTSKIHRTIHSNRYDIKKSFRDAELKIYYEMEPMEIIFKKMGGKLLSQEFKDKYIYKELLKSSAHDSLGGCNLDLSNAQILSRNNKVIDLVKSYIDIMKRDIKEMLNLSSNKYIVFNLSPFDRDVSFQDVISTNNNKILSSKSGEIIEYYQKNISWKEHDPIFNHSISIFAKKVRALSFKVISITENNETSEKPIEIKIKLKLENDLGDEFDFSYDKKNKPKYFDDFEHIKTVGNKFHKISIYKLEKLNLKLIAIKNSLGVEYKININNKFKNKRLSIIFPKNHSENIKLSRHLAIINQKIDKINDWKINGYKDEPINFFANDGLIVNKDKNILTKGNNELFIGEKEIEMTLFRAVGFLGKPNLNTRPGSASGLPMKCETPDAQLQKDMFFEFAINNLNSIQTFNDWNFKGTGQFSSNVNPILNSVERFVWNENKLNETKISLPKMDIKDILIGRFKVKNNNISMAFTSTKNKIKERILWKKIKL